MKKNMSLYEELKRYCEEELDFHIKTDRTQGVPSIYFAMGNYPWCPDDCVYITLDFHDNYLTIDVQYSPDSVELFENSPHKEDLFSFLNYVNCIAWIASITTQETDQSNYMFVPRIFLDEETDLHVIGLRTSIDIDSAFQHLRELKIFIFDSAPEILDMLAYPIFNLLSGNMKLQQAKDYLFDAINGKVA